MTREVEDRRRQLTRACRRSPAEWYEGPEGVGLRWATGCSSRWPGVDPRAPGGGGGAASSIRRRSGAGTEVRTPAGGVASGWVVAVTSGWSGSSRAGGRVRTVRLQMLATAPTDYPFPAPRLRATDTNTGSSSGRQDRARRVPGSGWKGSEVRRRPCQPVRVRSRRVPAEELGVDAPITHRWAASVGYTPDGLPILGKSGTASGWRRIQRDGNVVGMLSGALRQVGTGQTVSIRAGTAGQHRTLITVRDHRPSDPPRPPCPQRGSAGDLDRTQARNLPNPGTKPDIRQLHLTTGH